MRSYREPMECGRAQASGGNRSWRGQLGVWFACLALLIVTGVSTGATANADETPNGPDIVLVDFNDPSEVAAWTTVNDPVMGGRSTSGITFADGSLVFSGTISLENNGGFASARGPENPDIGRRAAGATALRIRAIGDGKTYVVKMGMGGQPWSYIQRFTTQAAVDRTYTLPIAGFQAVGMRLDPDPNAPQALDPAGINRISVYILDKQQGPFTLSINGIDAAV